MNQKRQDVLDLIPYYFAPAMSWLAFWVLYSLARFFELTKVFTNVNYLCIAMIGLGLLFLLLPPNKAVLRSLTRGWAIISAFMVLLIVYISIVLGAVGGTTQDGEGIAPGTLGDTFGAFNAIVAALALIGIAWALSFQYRERKLGEEKRVEWDRINRATIRLSLIPGMVGQELRQITNESYPLVAYIQDPGRDMSNVDAWEVKNVLQRLSPLELFEVTKQLDALHKRILGENGSNESDLLVRFLLSPSADLSSSQAQQEVLSRIDQLKDRLLLLATLKHDRDSMYTNLAFSEITDPVGRTLVDSLMESRGMSATS